VSSDLLTLEQHVRAKPKEVFADLTVADRMLRWWGDRTKWWLTKADVELRPGGQYWLSWENTKGETNGMGGRFKAIRPNQGFVLSFVGSHAKNYTDELAIDLEPEDGGTKVVLRHSGLAGRPERYADYQQGWTLILGWLARQYDTAAGKK
jgi:uncharacterized protein YndB with AHSA1/START domain